MKTITLKNNNFLTEYFRVCANSSTLVNLDNEIIKKLTPADLLRGDYAIITNISIETLLGVLKVDKYAFLPIFGKISGPEQSYAQAFIVSSFDKDGNRHNCDDLMDFINGNSDINSTFKSGVAIEDALSEFWKSCYPNNQDTNLETYINPAAETFNEDVSRYYRNEIRLRRDWRSYQPK